MSSTEEPNNGYDFIKSLSNFYKKLVSQFKDENPSNINNEIVYLGRTE